MINYVFLATISPFDIPRIEILFLKKEIEFIIKKPYESSLAGGWITPGSSQHKQSIFVNELKLEKARSLFHNNIDG